MKLGRTLAVAAAATIAVAPIAAQADVRTAAPVEGESQMSGYSALIVLAIVGLGIGIVASGADEPVSA